MRSSFVPGAALVALAALAGAAPTADAQITPGSTFTFTGTADATDIGLGGVFLDFTKHVTAAPTGNTGTFASLNRHGNGPQGNIADVRVGNGPEPIDRFLTIGPYKFSLAALPVGRYGQAACYDTTFAVGQTCTPYQSVQGQPTINAGLSPFYVANVSANPDGSLNSTAAFDLTGTVTGPGGATSSFFGTIAASFIGLPYQVVLYTLEQQGLQGLTFTGTFTAGAPLSGKFASSSTGTSGVVASATVTPEPASAALLGVGLLGAAGVARRRRTARGA
ncbi:MAG TPA: PEP-CTERM sorting domain-containing protein [Gemmatirosa sp.]